MKKFADKKEQVKAEFRSFMKRFIWNCERNVTRKMMAEERRNSGVPIGMSDLKSVADRMEESGNPQEEVVDVLQKQHSKVKLIGHEESKGRKKSIKNSIKVYWSQNS